MSEIKIIIIIIIAGCVLESNCIVQKKSTRFILNCLDSFKKLFLWFARFILGIAIVLLINPRWPCNVGSLACCGLNGQELQGKEYKRFGEVYDWIEQKGVFKIGWESFSRRKSSQII